MNVRMASFQLSRLKPLNQFDAVGDWLYNVAYSHSQSKATEEQYKRVWRRFTSCLGETAEQILVEYEASDDRTNRLAIARISIVFMKYCD